MQKTNELLAEVATGIDEVKQSVVAVNNSLHRLLDLTFPEFTSHVKSPVSQTALDWI